MSQHQQRKRGYCLTEQGLTKILSAIEQEFPDGHTLENIETRIQLQVGKKVSTDTISKIIKRTGRADTPKIQSLFRAFGVTLTEKDDLTREVPVPPPKKDDQNFVGRGNAINDLDGLINDGAKCILIQSPGGVGKSTLAERYLQRRFPNSFLRFDIAKETQNVSSAESLIEEKLRSLGEEPGRDFGVSLERLRQKLESEAMGVLVDNLEPALDENGRFIREHRSYVELLRVLCASHLQSITLITSRERVYENLDITLYRLKKLSLDAWGEYFQYGGVDSDSPVFEKIYHAYRGNALAMQVLRQRISVDYEGDVEDYWELCQTEEGISVETAINNLIAKQFNRLEQFYPTAYELLCRMGCFRYQDVPTVPKEGLLCLLWDVSEKEGVKAIQALRDRGLVERVNKEYKLHPLIREEAVKRLKSSEDWERANRTAAEFWTESVEIIETEKDARTALEGYYHYLQIADFNFAASVIAKGRDNHHEKSEPLGCSFYRLGLLSEIINSIELLQNKTDSSFAKARLYNILGDAYWMQGNLKNAISAHKKSRTIAKPMCDSFLKSNKLYPIYQKLYNVSFINVALCKIELLDISEAINLLKQIFNIAKANNNQRYLIESSFCLAFCYSCLNNHVNSRFYIKETTLFDDLLIHNLLTIWTIGYKNIYIGKTFQNFKELENAVIHYKDAIKLARNTKYYQLEAKALTGIAEIDRIQNNIKTALSHHTESIEILEKLGAKCDLAEAYYQLGLTYQAMGETPNSQDYFNKAITLWQKIDAPKQIERVQQSMGN